MRQDEAGGDGPARARLARCVGGGSPGRANTRHLTPGRCGLSLIVRVMFPRPLSSRCRVLAGVALWATGTAGAQPASASPFLPPAAATTAAPTAGAPIEFRGFMETGEGMRFRLYDPARKSGAWVKLNERDATLDVVAKQFNATPDSETLVVEHQGRTLTLAQRVSKVVSSGSAAQAMPPPPPVVTNVPPAVTQSVVVNPTPADEARRLEAVASEVARRRALREQASQQMGQPPPPPVAQPQVQPQSGPATGQPRPQRK